MPFFLFFCKGGILCGGHSCLPAEEPAEIGDIVIPAYEGDANVFAPGIPTVMEFTAGVTKIFAMEDFDRVSEMMERHTDGFIKGAFRS